MKKILICLLSIIIICLPASYTVLASDDNTYAGMDTIGDDLNTCIDDIIKHSEDFGSSHKLKEEDIYFSRTRRQYDVNPSVLFKDKKVTAASLKEIIENSEYAYFVLIYKGTETFNFIITKGTEPDPEKVKQGLYTEEALAYFEKYLGKWHVTGSGEPYSYLDPKNDCFGLMEKYLELKDIHNAEIYFIGRINDQAAYYAVIFTGRKMENGEDEIFFVAPEQLEYDDEGNLVYSWYDSGIKDFTEAEYTYAELRKIHKETYYIPGTGGGGIRIPTVLKIGFPVLIGVIIIWCIIKAVLRKRRKAK